jgi:hypothetical protein
MALVITVALIWLPLYEEPISELRLRMLILIGSRLRIHLRVQRHVYFFHPSMCLPPTCMYIYQSVHPLICLSIRRPICFVWPAIPWHSYCPSVCRSVPLLGTYQITISSAVFLVHSYRHEDIGHWRQRNKRCDQRVCFEPWNNYLIGAESFLKSL